MKKLTVAVFGASGRVGKRVVEMLQQRGYSVVEIEENTDTSAVVCQGVIDFSAAYALDNVCAVCKSNNAPLVSGTTGYNDIQMEKLQQLKQFVAVDYRQNFCNGVSVLGELVKVAKKMLPTWDCEIVEIHRRGKKDSPSGTALALSAQLTDTQNRMAGQPHNKTAIHSLRMGSVFGTHSVVFANKGEMLTLTHNAENVDIFAQGAIVALEKLMD